MYKMEIACFCGLLAPKVVIFKVNVKIQVNTIVDPINVVVIVYEGCDDNILFKGEFQIDSEFKYCCFKCSMEGIILSYCKSVREMTSLEN